MGQSEDELDELEEDFVVVDVELEESDDELEEDDESEDEDVLEEDDAAAGSEDDVVERLSLR